jgi:uncharacterized low-complexity protein
MQVAKVGRQLHDGPGQVETKRWLPDPPPRPDLEALLQAGRLNVVKKAKAPSKLTPSVVRAKLPWSNGRLHQAQGSKGTSRCGFRRCGADVAQTRQGRGGCALLRCGGFPRFAEMRPG